MNGGGGGGGGDCFARQQLKKQNKKTHTHTKAFNKKLIDVIHTQNLLRYVAVDSV